MSNTACSIVWGHICDLFKPLEINLENFDEHWVPYKVDAKRKLGNAKEGFNTLSALERKIKGTTCTYSIANAKDDRFFAFHNCRHESLHEMIVSFAKMVGNQDCEVGDPGDVHHIIPPMHRIGYAVSTSQDGLMVHEHFEGLKIQLEVLRRRGKIIAARMVYPMRMESYGPVTVL